LVKQGELRLLALFGDSRVNFFPEVPTGKELGYDLVLDAKMIIVGPANLPSLVTQKLEDAFSAPINSPGYQKMLKDLCVTNEPFRGSKALQKLLLEEDKLNKEIIRTSGLAKE
jgi:tripartite-type tricarboxylate transporter receptor subunit TctC